jgi:hypothetical protein
MIEGSLAMVTANRLVTADGLATSNGHKGDRLVVVTSDGHS